MEQLFLLEFNDIRRPTKGKELNFESVAKGFQLQYKHPNGKLYQGNSIDWLASLEDASVDLVFADPPYNIKKADWDSFESQEHPIAWSIQWISLASWVLKPTCSLVWLFGNFGGFEASGFKLFQALPLADLALTLFADYAGQLTQRRNHNLPMAC